MSNYYISKCCGEQIDIISLAEDGVFKCQKCNRRCQVTAMIDSPGGVLKEDCQVCGREEGHIKPIKKPNEKI